MKLLVPRILMNNDPKTNRFGQPIKVNWAYTSTQREDTSGLELKDVLNINSYHRREFEVSEF
jgi:hypothetical protein